MEFEEPILELEGYGTEANPYVITAAWHGDDQFLIKLMERRLDSFLDKESAAWPSAR